MNILDTMTIIFEYENFATILTATTLGLFLLFIIVLIAGLRDKKKKNAKPVELIKEELEEVTMEALKEELIINEEVTLEMPSITKNLEEFKKAIEEEIKYEDEDTKMDVQLSKSLLNNSKAIKILNINEIENTVIVEPKKKEQTKPIELMEVEEEKIEESIIEEPISIKEESIVEVQKLNIPFLKTDADEELLFKTMTALRIPQDI